MLQEKTRPIQRWSQRRLPLRFMWQGRVRYFLSEHSFADDKDWQTTKQLLDDVAAYRMAYPRSGLTRGLFDRIVQWKLRDQMSRAADHLAELNDKMILEITGAVFRLDHSNLEVSSRVRTEVLQGLPGVGLGVASALLTTYFPESFGIIDFRAWDELHDRDPNLPAITRTFSIGHYMTYLATIRPFAAEIGKNPQVIDYALWKIWKQRRTRV
jgi:hypothetical protein